MQDSVVGMFLEFNFEFAASLPAAGTAFSKNLSFNGDQWTIQCYPRGGAPESADESYLTVRLVNLLGGGAREKKAKVVFHAIALCRADKEGRFFSSRCELDYPTKGDPVFLRAIFRTSDLADHCVVNGYVTVLCGVAILEHSPIPVQPSKHARDLLPLAVRSPYGDPDVTFAVGDELVPERRRVLAARSPVFRAELPGAMEESAAPVVRPPREFGDATFLSVLWYVYNDRVPRGAEPVGLLAGSPRLPTMEELLRELLAAADLFTMDRLKLVCTRRLWEDVSPETVSKTLYYADRYNCRELRNACVHYMAQGGRMRQVAVTDEYVWLAQNYPNPIDVLRQRIMAEHIRIPTV